MVRHVFFGLARGAVIPVLLAYSQLIRVRNAYHPSDPVKICQPDLNIIILTGFLYTVNQDDTSFLITNY